MTPPGWYNSPATPPPGMLQYWDGTGWTNQLQKVREAKTVSPRKWGILKISAFILNGILMAYALGQRLLIDHYYDTAQSIPVDQADAATITIDTIVLAVSITALVTGVMLFNAVRSKRSLERDNDGVVKGKNTLLEMLVLGPVFVVPSYTLAIAVENILFITFFAWMRHW